MDADRPYLAAEKILDELGGYFSGKFFRVFYEALAGSKKHNAEIWQRYEEQGTLNHYQVMSLVCAYIRHNHTKYDRLLRSGTDRVQARRTVQQDVEDVLNSLINEL